MNRGFLLLGFAIVCSLWCGAQYPSRAIGADIAFGSRGRVITQVANTGSQCNAVALQTDGKIVTAGITKWSSTYHGFFVTRYNATGVADTAFAGTGFVSMDLGAYEAAAQDVLVQPDGKIVVAGNFIPTAAGNAQGFMVRFNSNGMLDSSFGLNGIKTIANARFNRIRLLPGGLLMVLGIAYDTVRNTAPLAVFRFYANGNPDPAFANNGVAVRPFQSYPVTGELLLQPDGKILISGCQVGNYIGHFLSRYLPNGLPDTLFANKGTYIDSMVGTGGYFRANTSVLLQSGSKILFKYSDVTSQAENNYLVKFDSTGQIDSTYGVRGRVLINVPYGSLIGAPNDQTYIVDFYNKVTRLQANGVVDSTYGLYGQANMISAGLVYAAILQPDGKMLAAGRTGGANPIVNSAVFRYAADGIDHSNTLKCFAFYDKNFNAVRDTGEPYFPYGKIFIAKDNADTISQWGANGVFEVSNDTGTYVTTFVPYVPYFHIVPSIYTVSHSTYFNTDSFSFAVQPLANKSDVAVWLVPLTPLRPGFVTTYKIMYANVGTDTVVNGSIVFVKSNKLDSAKTTPAYTSIVNDTLIWNYSNLKPWDTASIEMSFLADRPPSLNLGDTIRCIARITPIGNDQFELDNRSILDQIVRNSYDPNDKTENHGGKIELTKAKAGEYLIYTIRFQNTGNDTAFNVYIHDTLDSKLDWSTLQMITASHNYQMTMNDGKCKWTFPNIMLVDSNKNEPLSHGYVVYRIKAKPSVQLGDIIKNKAAIYFDYNLPIITNIEMTTIVADVLPLKLLSFIAKKENKTNLLNWKTAEEVNVSHFEIERSNNPNSSVGTGGREFSKIGTVKAGYTSYSFTDEKPATGNTNYYRLKMMDRDGQFTYSPIRMINNNSSFYVNVYPNPAKDVLQVQIGNDKKSALQLIVLSGDGKVVLSKNITAVEGSSLLSINISTLPKGSYLLKILSSLNPPLEGSEAQGEQVVKFEKL